MPEVENLAAVSNSGAAAARPKLFDEVRRRLRLKHHSLRTEQAYLYWIRRHIHFNGRRQDVTTTQIYTHVLNRGTAGVLSPLDR